MDKTNATKEDSFSDFISEFFLEQIGNMAIEPENFLRAEDMESKLEAAGAYSLLLCDTPDAKIIKLIEDETNVVLIENDNATEDENKQQKRRK